MVSDAPSWLATSFPNLVHLDVCDNRALHHLPIRIITLRHLRHIFASGNRALRASKSLPKIQSKKYWRHRGTDNRLKTVQSQGVHTLLSHTARTIVTHLSGDFSELPAHLSERLREAYTCELCEKLQINLGEGGNGNWLPHRVVVAWDASTWRHPEPSLRVEGRICRLCMHRGKPL